MALGLLPLAGVLLLKNGLRPFLRWPNLLLALPLAGLLVVYLTRGTATLPQGWLWEFYGWEPLFKGLRAFYLIEFMTLAGLLWLVRPPLRRDPFFLAAVVTLLLVPWYQMGIYGDFSRRASLPAIMLLCWYTAAFLANTRGRVLRGWALGGLIVVLGIGTFNPLFQVLRATSHHSFGGFHYGQHRLIYWEKLIPKLHDQYMTYDIPIWYLSLLRDKDDAYTNIGIEKGELIIRSNYDVYLDDDRAIYIKDPCFQSDIEPRFFLHVYPVDSDDLPAKSRQRGYDTLDFSFPGHGFRSGGKCLAIHELPRYAISRIETGQLTSGDGMTRVVWEGSFAVGE